MNTTLSDAIVLATQVRNGLQEIHGVQVVLCPPFPWLVPLKELLSKGSPPRQLHLGAQNMFWEDEGPYTGEVSGAMLKHLVSYVILGHSERVAHFGETPQMTNRKVKSAIKHGLKPIVCVGELKKGSNPRAELIKKLQEIFDGVTHDALGERAIAYEPVWAIGTGDPASGVQAQHVAEMIRDEFGDEARMLYGGSVEPTNALEFLRQVDIDGLLVGGTSLSASKFLKICELAPYD